MQDNNGG